MLTLCLFFGGWYRLMDDFPTMFGEGFGTHFAASGVAGFVCSAASNPGELETRGPPY